MSDAGLPSVPPRRVSGFAIILLATFAAGLCSYVVTWLVPRIEGFAAYSVFAIFWSFIYLLVGALSGIQQEVTRGTEAAADPARRSRAVVFAVSAALIVGVVVVLTAILWSGAVFPQEGWELVWPLALGATGFVIVSVVVGSLYGVSAWVPLGLMLVVDAFLRLAFISVVLAVHGDVVELAWAVAIPFGATPLILLPVLRRALRGSTQLNVPFGQLVWNSSRTILAAAATGVMVSGFPLVLGLTSHRVPAAELGLVVLTVTLVRAPLIISAMSLQSYFIVLFRSSRDAFARSFGRIAAVILGGGAVLAVVGWLIGPFVFHLLFPGNAQPRGWFIAVLVASSALVGLLCVTAPAVLARDRHRAYTAGWVAGAVLTVAAVLLPLDFQTRTIVALLVGPVAGLAIHGGSLIAGRHRAEVKS